MPATRKEWPGLNPSANIAPQQEGAHGKEKGAHQNQHVSKCSGISGGLSEAEGPCSHHLCWRALSISFIAEMPVARL